MKKLFSLMLCVALITFILMPIAAQAADKCLIIDDTGSITEDGLNELNQYAREISSEYQMDVAFFMVANTYSPEQSLRDHIKERYLNEQALGPDGFVLVHDTAEKLWSIISFGEAQQLITDDIEDHFWDAYVYTGDTFYSGVLGYLEEAEAFLAEQTTLDEQNTTPAEDTNPISKAEQPFIPVAQSFFAPGSGNYVLDETGSLTSEQIASLNGKAAAFTQKRECGIYIWIVDIVPEEYANSIDNMEIYADAFYEKYDLGYGDDKSGMVLLLEIGDIPGERDYLLNTHGSRSETISQSRREYLLDEIVPLFKDAFSTGDFHKVVDEFLDLLDSQFAIATTIGMILDLAVVVLIPLLVARGVCAVWKRQMKTAVLASHADNYIPEGGFNLTNQSDQFLYRTTSRTKIERSSSSSGGSSSSSSGRSSGGKV